jgi:hypothetical protein
MPNGHIVLRSFSQRITAWPDGDWSGISDPKLRRKMQNRLNQRVRRKPELLNVYGYRLMHGFSGLCKHRVREKEAD